ncbi:MAG: hypothetical protein JWM12_3305, partial [Ilumatobacteraceae bacterium]|nr:hypothetical protein [Ilumatobacteraceae bacterium]
KRFGTNWKEEATYRRTGAGNNGIATAFPSSTAAGTSAAGTSPTATADWVPRDRVPVTRESAPISSR